MHGSSCLLQGLRASEQALRKHFLGWTQIWLPLLLWILWLPTLHKKQSVAPPVITECPLERGGFRIQQRQMPPPRKSSTGFGGAPGVVRVSLQWRQHLVKLAPCWMRSLGPTCRSWHGLEAGDFISTHCWVSEAECRMLNPESVPASCRPWGMRPQY